MIRLLPTFTPTRARAQPYVNSLAAEGISTNEALDMLRGAGIGYRRTDFLADYRYYRGAEISGTYVRSLPRTARFNPDRLEVSRQRLPERFRFIVRNEVRLVDGRIENRTVAVDTPDIDVRMRIEGVGSGIISDPDVYDDVEDVLDTRIVEGFRSEGAFT